MNSIPDRSASRDPPSLTLEFDDSSFEVRLADALAPQKLPQTLPKSNEDRRRRTHPLPRTRQCNRLRVQSDMEQLLLLRPKGLPP